MAWSCAPSDNPPTTSAAGNNCLPRSALNWSTTCIANSRVGTRTSAAIPGVLSLSNFSITGIRNASVLPVPVCAVASTSLPSRACGIVAACTGVGVVNFAAVNLSLMQGEISISENRAEARSVRGSRELSAFTSEPFNIQYYFLAGRSRRGAHTSSRAGGLLCQLLFRLRVKRTEETGGGSLRSSTAPEGPHNTTEVISAKRVYHISARDAGI